MTPAYSRDLQPDPKQNRTEANRQFGFSFKSLVSTLAMPEWVHSRQCERSRSTKMLYIITRLRNVSGICSGTAVISRFSNGLLKTMSRLNCLLFGMSMQDLLLSGAEHILEWCIRTGLSCTCTNVLGSAAQFNSLVEFEIFQSV